MQSFPLSTDGQQLLGNLEAASRAADTNTEEKVHVAGVAAGLYAAYEKLRNAAEYNEQHLLLRAAIERFLRRNMLFRGHTAGLGYELVVELTEAGYLQNDSIGISKSKHIDEFINQYSALAKTVESTHRVTHEKARRWTLQILSVCIEKLLVPDQATDGFLDFAQKHYKNSVSRDSFDHVSETEFHDALYIAVHRALFKSDIATVRFYMYNRALLGGAHQTTHSFVEVCKTVDEQFQSPLTNRLSRLINRNAAPMRILRETMAAEAHPATALTQHTNLLGKVRAVAEKQYNDTHKRLVKGVIRAIIFIFITKMIVGLAIEIPYDLFVLGHIAMLPLVVNLLFAPLYMATAGWSIKKPGPENTEAITQHIERMLFQTEKPAIAYKAKRRVDAAGLRASFNFVYGLAFIISFGLVVLLLRNLEFTIVHGTIFFIFFSAVSFLRFRLIQSARELELVDNRQSLASAIADFFYTPFIRLGQWISDQYRQVNIISILLDFAIELPLKTSLRLLRQWTSFMRDKRDEM